MSKRKQGAKGETSTSYMDLKDQRMELKSIMKDIENLGSTHMTWKERKELENRKVVSLGGKLPKKQRLPLSVARVVMKKQKERDQKVLQENMILGRFGGKHGSGTKKVAEKRKPEDRVLKSTVGHFRDGVLDVKQLLKPAASSRDSGNTGGGASSHGGSKGKGKKKKGGRKKQNKKGGGRKRH